MEKKKVYVCLSLAVTVAVCLCLSVSVCLCLYMSLTIDAFLEKLFASRKYLYTKKTVATRELKNLSLPVSLCQEKYGRHLNILARLSVSPVSLLKKYLSRLCLSEQISVH